MKAGLTVSKYMAASAIELLTNPKLIQEAWEEHNKYVAEFGYKETVPPEVKVPSFEDLYGIKPEAVREQRDNSKRGRPLDRGLPLWLAKT